MSRLLLIFLLLFNAVGAFYGSYMLIADPAGVEIGLPPGMLEGSPFHNYLVPGLVLLLVNGVLPATAAYGLTRRRPSAPLPVIPVLKNYHWAWSLALLSGLGLMIWMGVQIALLGYYKEFPIQGVMSVVGVAITGLTLLPGMRAAYRFKPGH